MKTSRYFRTVDKPISSGSSNKQINKQTYKKRWAPLTRHIRDSYRSFCLGRGNLYVHQKCIIGNEGCWFWCEVFDIFYGEKNRQNNPRRSPPPLYETLPTVYSTCTTVWDILKIVVLQDVSMYIAQFMVCCPNSSCALLSLLHSLWKLWLHYG